MNYFERISNMHKSHCEINNLADHLVRNLHRSDEGPTFFYLFRPGYRIVLQIDTYFHILTLVDN